MKVILKGVMPDKAKIQIEDWNENYKWFSKSSTVATFPICKMYVANNFAAMLGQTMRAALNFDNAEQAKTTFDKLISGEKKIEDYTERLDPKIKIEWITGVIQ